MHDLVGVGPAGGQSHPLELPLTGHDCLGQAFGTDEAARRTAWFEHGDELLADYIRENPGKRPWAWWRYEAPEPRRRLGGASTSSEEAPHCPDWARGSSFGKPRVWAGDVCEENPPRFESEAVYLERLGLLSDEELEFFSRAEMPEEEIVEIPPCAHCMGSHEKNRRRFCTQFSST